MQRGRWTQQWKRCNARSQDTHLGPEQDQKGGHLCLLSPFNKVLNGVLRLLLCQVCACK